MKLILIALLTSIEVLAGTFKIIDVRTQDEFKQGHLKGSINIDIYDSNFSSQISKLDKNSDYKVYCRSGNRSGQALEIMKKLGFTKVENSGSLENASKKLNVQIEK